LEPGIGIPKKPSKGFQYAAQIERQRESFLQSTQSVVVLRSLVLRPLPPPKIDCFIL